MDEVQFSTLVKELSQGVHAAQLMVEQTKLDYFMSYFTEENGALRADTRNIKVKYHDSGEQKEGSFTVPLATLVSHNGLALDTAEVDIHIRLSASEQGLMVQSGGHKGETGQESAEIADIGECDVKLVFRNEKPAPGIQEAINLLNKTI